MNMKHNMNINMNINNKKTCLFKLPGDFSPTGEWILRISERPYLLQSGFSKSLNSWGRKTHRDPWKRYVATWNVWDFFMVFHVGKGYQFDESGGVFGYCS